MATAATTTTTKTAITTTTTTTSTAATMSMAGTGFRSFCDLTTLHGWQYIGNADANHKIKLYFWSVIVCLSMVTAGIFLYYNTWASLPKGLFTRLVLKVVCAIVHRS